MYSDGKETVIGTIKLSPVDQSPLTASLKRSSVVKGDSLLYALNGREVSVGPIHTGFWPLTKRKHLSYINALFQWFVDHESQVQRAVIDTEYNEVCDKLAHDMQWYCGEKDEAYLKNFPCLRDPDCDVSSCREQIVTRQELMDNTYIYEIELEYEDSLISKAIFYCYNKPEETTSEKMRQLMDEFDGESFLGAYFIEWEGIGERR